VTWPAGIAAALGILTAYLIACHQHTESRSTTEQHHHPQDGEQP